MSFFSRKTNKTEKAREEFFEGIYFGDVPIHPDEATSHFMAVGATGSGKTINLGRLLQSELPKIPIMDARALMTDPKQDAMSRLSAFVPPDLIHSLNPYEERGYSWNMCADIQEYRLAIELAYTLLPEQHGESQPFFSDACRHLMIGALKNFLVTGREWTFGDLIRVLMNSRILKQLLRQIPETRELVHLYLSDSRLAANVMATMATKLLLFEPIAGCWEGKRSVSLHDWVRGQSIIVLGNSEISRTALDAINRCIVKRASDITLNLSESRSRRVWFIFDELASVGRLDGLVSSSKMGRSKRSVLVIAFQSVSGLRDPKLYGQHFSDELLGQFGNRFFGRLECPVTAEWASQIVGDQEVTSRSVSISNGPNGSSTSHTYQDQVRRTVLASQFMNIEPCTRENGLTGLYLLRSIGAFFMNTPGDKLFDELLVPPRSDVPDFVPRDPRQQMLANWTHERAAYFGVQSSADPEAVDDSFEDLFNGPKT